MLKLFARYVSNVFHLPRLVKSVRDSRHPTRRRIPTHAVLLAWILGFAARISSREELGRLLDRPQLQRLIGRHISSDSCGRIAGQLGYRSLHHQLLFPILRQMRRNKCWSPGSIGHFVAVALDGTECVAGTQPHCPHCIPRKLSDGRTVYVHKAVWAFLVGAQPQVILGFEPVRPGESEVAAARRLVNRLARAFPWVHLFLLDAGFAHGRFLTHIRNLGRFFIVRVKDEARRHLLQDAQGLAAHSSPTASWQVHLGHHHLQVSTWDIEGFTSWESYPDPLRVLVADEQELPQPVHRRRRLPYPGRVRHRAFYVTNLTPQQLPTDLLWQAAHKRWTLENTGFHQFKHQWHLDHAFAHHSHKALYATWLLFAAAHNLFVAFVHRRLRTGREGRLPDSEFARQLMAALRLDPLDALPYLAPG